MNSKEIKNLIQNGEKIDVEFKESKNSLRIL
jgi:ATP-dependent DNA helicase RecG